MSASTATINLSGLTSALGEVLNIFIQYLPILATVAIVVGIIGYFTGGLSNVLGGITGLFG
jgi:hypothetical protein